MPPSVSVGLLRAQSDDRLLALARDGHERAFEVLVRRYDKQLLAYGRRLLPASLAEDAVQQGLLQAWLALQRRTEVRDLGPWLYRTVYHSAIRIRRTSANRSVPVPPAPTAEAPQVELERRIAARDALAEVAALPAQQREALVQTVIDGRSHRQVAETLGLTDGAVRGLLYRARATLRAAATAVTPWPLVTWAVHGGGVRAGSSDAHLVDVVSALSEAAPGAGGAGVAAALGRGGAVAASAGVLLAGTAAMHSALSHQHPRPTDHPTVTTQSPRDEVVRDLDAGLGFPSAPRSTTSAATESATPVATGSASPVARSPITATGAPVRTGAGRGNRVSTGSYRPRGTGTPNAGAPPSTAASAASVSPSATTGSTTTDSSPPAAENPGPAGSDQSTDTPSGSEGNASAANTSPNRGNGIPASAATVHAAEDSDGADSAAEDSDGADSPATSPPSSAATTTAGSAAPGDSTSAEPQSPTTTAAGNTPSSGGSD